MIVAEFGTGQVFLSMLWFFLFFIWIWLLIVVFSDIFRSRDLSGWAKALWVIFVIIVPYLGVFVYLIARGHKMQEHAVQAAQAQDAAMGDALADLAHEHLRDGSLQAEADAGGDAEQCRPDGATAPPRHGEDHADDGG